MSGKWLGEGILDGKGHEMKETVIYIGGFELPDKNAAAHRVVHNAKAFRELGKRVVLIGTSHELLYAADVGSTKAAVHGFDCYAVPYPGSLPQWKDYLTGINRYLEILKLYKNINAVILYDFPSVELRKMMDYCKNKGIHCYADVTEWYSAKGRGMAYAMLKGCDTFYRMRVYQPL